MKEKIREIRSIWNTMNVDIVYVEVKEITRLQKLSEKWTFFPFVFLFVGTAGDSLGYHRAMLFSTKDRDSDKNSGNSGWWYNSCHSSNLNGLYLNGKEDSIGMCWYHWKNNYYSLKRSEMKIRPQNF